MSLTYTQHSLYGGAITVTLPKDLIDASDLREIPDHQEVFLREHTLTSIIFEINEYQTSNHIGAGDFVADANTSQPSIGNDGIGESAALHHLTDIIQPPDHIVQNSSITTRVSLTKPSVAEFPSYCTLASIITPEIDLREAARQATLPVAWQSNPVQKEYETKTQQLLVRMQTHEVDLCVRINAPLKEFTNDEIGSGNGPESGGNVSLAGNEELRWADQVMDTITKTLDVKDFGLFGGEA